MKTPLPTHSEMDELIQFLPKLYAEGFEPVRESTDARMQENGVIEMAPTEYDDQVTEFFQAASKEAWRDTKYFSTAAGEMLKSPDSIETASLKKVRSMLTHCVRGERFCDGHWESVISGGQIRLILTRLQVLRSALVPQSM